VEVSVDCRDAMGRSFHATKTLPSTGASTDSSLGMSRSRPITATLKVRKTYLKMAHYFNFSTFKYWAFSKKSFFSNFTCFCEKIAFWKKFHLYLLAPSKP